MLKCSISAADPGPGAAFSEFPVASRLSVTGLCSTSFCSRSTSAFMVALMSMHWQPLGTCADAQFSQVTSQTIELSALHLFNVMLYIQRDALYPTYCFHVLSLRVLGDTQAT